MRGDIRYKDASSGVEISTDVVYTIHLGGVEGVDDYNLLRNTYYTYNVKIVSVDKIIKMCIRDRSCSSRFPMRPNRRSSRNPSQNPDRS